MSPEARCARAGCDAEPERFAWGWVDMPRLQPGWALFHYCPAHFAAVEPALQRAAETGYAVIDGPPPLEAPVERTPLQ